MNTPEKPILIFDADCPLCVRFKQALSFLDKDNRVQMTPLQDESLFENFPQFNKSECEQEIHLLKLDGEAIGGAEVIEYLVSMFPGVQKFAWLVESESGKKAVSYFYDKVNELREKVKKDCPGCGKERR